VRRNRQEVDLDVIHTGDCVEVLATLPEGCVDLVFADPPYNLQLRGGLHRPDLSRVDAVDDAWDHFGSFTEYDRFTRAWLEACRRVLSPTGTLWVIGTYHNIHRVGAILQDVGFWILNDVAWVKANPMPQFRGVRFCNAHETLIWAKRSAAQSRYTFNYKRLKAANEDLQMRSDWRIPLCQGEERLRDAGGKVHSTQKPEALLRRILAACTNPGDVVLDPFFGSGTTGAVAKRLGRRWIGIEREPRYVQAARQRISAVVPAPCEALDLPEPPPTRVPFVSLLELGLVREGAQLALKGCGATAVILCDGTLAANGHRGSIHAVGARLLGTHACNGWEHWLYVDPDTGRAVPLDDLRTQARRRLGLA